MIFLIWNLVRQVCQVLVALIWRVVYLRILLAIEDEKQSIQKETSCSKNSQKCELSLSKPKEMNSEGSQTSSLSVSAQQSTTVPSQSSFFSSLYFFLFFITTSEAVHIPSLFPKNNWQTHRL